MNAVTVAALNRINRQFYARHSESFGATRTRPWPGWNRAIKPFLLQTSKDPGAKAARDILDLGCGNGRFAAFVHSISRDPYRYLGLDSSEEMIGQARLRLQGVETFDAQFRRYDLADDGSRLDFGARRFDLVVLVGVLHHLPGISSRRQLLSELAGSLASGGHMILSFWQFGRDSRFLRRTLSWSDHNRLSVDPVDEHQLESGDYLLAWGNSDDIEQEGEDSLGARRYCHFADASEAKELIGAVGLRTVDCFESDGRSGDLNLYFVLEAT